MKIRLALSTLALTFGVLVVGVSLSTASQVKSVEGTGGLADKSLYWDRPIGPDHSLYAFLMINDRIKLETASPTERVYIQISYAHTRLEQGKELVKDNPELAASTLTKGEKYLLHAAGEYFQLEQKPTKLGNQLLNALQLHHTAITEIVHDLPHDFRPPLDQLRLENASFQELLIESL